MWYEFFNRFYQISISRFFRISCLFILAQSRAQPKQEAAIDIAGQQALDELREVGRQLLKKCKELQEEYSNPNNKQGLKAEVENLKAELQALREGKEKPAEPPQPKPDRTKEMINAVTEFAREAIIEVEQTAADGAIAVTKAKEGFYCPKEYPWTSKITEEERRIVKALEYIIGDMRDLTSKQEEKEMDDNWNQTKKEMDERQKERDEKWNQTKKEMDERQKERDEKWAKEDEESREMIKWFETTAERWTSMAEKAIEKVVDK